MIFKILILNKLYFINKLEKSLIKHFRGAKVTIRGNFRSRKGRMLINI